jgi:hypothetical protein
MNILFAVAIGALLGALGAFVAGVVAIVLPFIHAFELVFWVCVLLGFLIGAAIGLFWVLSDSAVALNVLRQVGNGDEKKDSE